MNKRTIGANLWTILLVKLIICHIVYSKRAEPTSFSQNLGPISLHANTGRLPAKTYPLRWDEKYATRKAIDFVRYMRTQPEFNPLHINGSMGPYRIHFNDVKLFANLTLDNVVVTGFKDTRFPVLEVRLAPSRIDSNISAPRLATEASFILNGTLTDQPLYVYGQINMAFIGLDIGAALGPKSHGDIYALDSADVTIGLKDVQVQMDMNEYADEIKTILFNFFQNTEQLIIDTNILRVLFKTINQQLRKFPSKQVFMFIFSLDDDRRSKKENKQRINNSRSKYSNGRKNT